MQKLKKKSNAWIIAIVIFSMMAVYMQIPVVEAASMSSVKVVLNDSDKSATATSTATFTLGTGLVATDYIIWTFPAGFTIESNATTTCPAGMSFTATTTTTLKCTADGPVVAGSYSMVISRLTNPSGSDSYTVTIESKTAANAVIETGEVKVYIIDDVTVTAHVPATLTFIIEGKDNGTGSMHGTTTNATSTATTIQFETLSGTPKIAAQALKVSTNATAGFSVTVKQDGEMVNAAGNNINSFANAINSAGSSTNPVSWVSPLGVLDQTYTYGHMGITSDDGGLDGTVWSLADSTTDPFGSDKWAGLAGTAPMQVMYHDGPADGSTPGKGLVNVVYAAQISPLQEAGDYTGYLTYVCTPTY